MSKKPENDEMRAEYDFSEGIRGKYAKRFAEGSNVVVLDPDVAAAFKTPKSVNSALRDYLKDKKAGVA
ncbi:MAG: hypothetical protein WBG86_05105 [Polyangiales bacterium]